MNYVTEITFTRNVKPDKLRNYRGKGNMVINRSGKQPIVFRGGVYKTSDRETINTLLRSSEIRRGDIVLTTPRDLVDKYLSGEEPDRLTEDVLEMVDKEGLQKIASAVNVPTHLHGNYPNVIRSMVVGKPITNQVYHIIQEHKMDTPEENKLKEFEESGRIYRSGPWYKFMKGTEENAKKDFSLGRTKGEAHRWIAENEDLIAQIIEKHEEKEEETE